MYLKKFISIIILNIVKSIKYKSSLGEQVHGLNYPKQHHISHRR
jgi:hypothetical protein